MSGLTEAPSGLRGFMAERRAILERRYAELDAQIAPIRTELAEIAAVERALTGAPKQGPHVTLQQMAVEILGGSATGLTTRQIAAGMKTRYGRDVTRESLAPQLSRLQRKGVTVSKNGVHRIAGRTALSQPAKGDDDADS